MELHSWNSVFVCALFVALCAFLITIILNPRFSFAFINVFAGFSEKIK